MNVIRCSFSLAAIGLLAAALAIAQDAPTSPTPSPTAVPTPSPTPPAPEPAPPVPASPAPAPAPAANPTYFNPAIAVIGNFLGIAGHNPVDDQPSLQLRESELSLQAVVDPYARADFFLSFSNDGVEVEEGFVTFLHLPWDLLLKAGQFKAQFGKVNLMHLHVLPWADEPLPIVNLLGSEEGWSDAGVSLAKLIGLPGDTFSELTAQLFRGDTEGLFDAPSRSKLAFAAQYRAYRDFGDDHNLELGVSYGRGYNGVTPDTTTQLGNVHLVYRWKPLRGRPYRSLIVRSELFTSRREQEGPTQKSLGFYAGADFQLGRRWFAGARYEFSDRPNDDRARDRGEAVTLTFWPSEFSQIRGEFRQRIYSPSIKAYEGLLQLQFSIGAHGAHPF
ncbi:MAG: hypothetical protein ACRD3M_15275 [Thermoanaerobaculia bacterium]